MPVINCQFDQWWPMEVKAL